jgi:hypothetical protein
MNRQEGDQEREERAKVRRTLRMYIVFAVLGEVCLVGIAIVDLYDDGRWLWVALSILYGLFAALTVYSWRRFLY